MRIIALPLAAFVLALALLTDPVIGGRKNDVEAYLPLFRGVRTAQAPKGFLDALKSEGQPEF